MRLLLLGCLLVASVAIWAAPASAQVRLQHVGDFSSPVFVTGAPGDYERLYVVEQDGAIRVVRGGAKQAEPFVDLSGEVLSPRDPGGGLEQGLLSMAFAPDFQRSRFLYVYYNDLEGDIRVEELRATSPDRADAGYRRVVLEILHREAQNHNGGQLQFGGDGFLYLGTGDGGNSYDEPVDDAQNPTSLLGKVLRVNPRTGSPPEVWSIGLRNPYRFSFDRATGDLTIADVGQGMIEEVDYVPAGAGAGRGANFGWDRCEGSLRSDPPPTTSAPCPPFGDVRPVIEQTHAAGWCSIIGGYVVRDASLPSLLGRYVYGDFCLGALRSALLRTPTAADDRPLGLGVPRLSSFGEDTAGCVYAASLNGPVYRLVESSTAVPCPSPPGGGSSTGGDRTAPVLRVRVPRRQRVLRRRGAIAYARCNERCTIAMSGRLLVGRRSYELRRASSSAAAGRRVALRTRLTRRARRALHRALRARRRATVRVALRARDGAGNRSALKRGSVRVRR